MTQQPPDTSSSATAVVHVSVGRWLWSIGLTALMLALLWHHHLNPASESYPWGQLLVMLYAMLMWIYAGRRYLLLRRVRQVFGDSIAHLPMPVLPKSYLWGSLAMDALVVGSLLYMGRSSFAWFYGLGVVAVLVSQHPRLLSSHR